MTLIEGLVVIRPHDTPPTGVLGKLFWWEYDQYIGPLGLAFILVFGLCRRWRPLPTVAPDGWRVLERPMLVMAVSSMGLLYAPIAMLPLPHVSAERVSSRFSIMPLLALIVMAVVRFQYELTRLRQHALFTPFALAALAQRATALAMHSASWRLSVIEAERAPVTPLAEIDATLQIASRADPLYVALVNASLLVSVTSGLLLFGRLLYSSAVAPISSAAPSPRTVTVKR